ncbi:unnamed protein product [Agarophyton chilense]
MVTHDVPKYMTAAVLLCHGTPENLVISHEVPVPKLLRGEALIRVRACGVNNTDINTRLGWYDSSVQEGTCDLVTDSDKVRNDFEGTWSGLPMAFPRIQGADVVGDVVAVGDDVEDSWIGCRVLVDPGLRQDVREGQYEGFAYLGSERDGGFAQFAAVPVQNLVKVNSTWTDEELATLPCSYTTAENMLDNAQVGENDVVLVTGASGGVGSALVQLTKRRKAKVIALTSMKKADLVLSSGADCVIRRGIDDWEEVIRETTGRGKVSVVADVVGAPVFEQVMQVLGKGGRYVTSGAIAGKMVQVDLSQLYLNDWRMIGCTVTRSEVMRNLVSYVERDEIRPLLAGVFPLQKIHEVEKLFLEKKHCGKYVLVPPPSTHM